MLPRQFRAATSVLASSVRQLHATPLAARPSLLEGAARDSALQDLGSRGWSHDETRDAVTKTFEFSSFVDAFGFMAKAALHAEKMNHHPELFNVYSRVEVTLTTHDCDGLSSNDTELALIMDDLASSSG